MRFKLFALVSTLSLVTLLSGCVSIKAHIVDRPRVDQELPAGAEEQYPNREKTRQVIVIDVDKKNAPEAGAAVGTPELKTSGKTTEGQSQVVTAPKATTVVHDDNFTFPKMDTKTLNQGATTAQGALEQYTVQKDDTLQKISKKLYGSYSKWTVIYDANRDVIKDPNFLKPGKILKIPVLANAAPVQVKTEETTPENK